MAARLRFSKRLVNKMDGGYILQLFADLRNQFLDVAANLPRSRMTRIPHGFRNHMHWQMGHVLTVTDELIFQISGLGSRIPPDYKAFFAPGTSPADWTGEPPPAEVLLEELERQRLEIRETFRGGNMAQPLAESNFLQAGAVGDLFCVLIAHESLHLGMIQAMDKVLSSE